MDKNGVYLQLYKRAPAPNRDYYGLTITHKEVILNIWNITHGPHTYPKRQKCPLEDFSLTKSFKAEVERLFGIHVLNYCQNLSNGDLKLQCLPTKIFLYILRYLATNDIMRLSQTSKIFFELCNRESTWMMLFGKLSKKRPSCDDIESAKLRGWKNVLMTKLLLQEPKRLKTKSTKSAPNVNSGPININNHLKTSKTTLSVSETPIKMDLVRNDRKIRIPPKIASKPKDELKKSMNTKKPNVIDINANPFKLPKSYVDLPKTNEAQFRNPVKPFTFHTSSASRTKTMSDTNLNNSKVMNYSTKHPINNKTNMSSKSVILDFIDNMSKKDKNINAIGDQVAQQKQQPKSGMRSSSSTKNTNHVKFK